MKTPMSVRIAQAVDCAEGQFWESIGSSLSDNCETGDFPPEAALELHKAMMKAVKLWVNLNTNEEYQP
jgi:hypothetical protein